MGDGLMMQHNDSLDLRFDRMLTELTAYFQSALLRLAARSGDGCKQDAKHHDFGPRPDPELASGKRGTP
jgi:hypothetical protein